MTIKPIIFLAYLLFINLSSSHVIISSPEELLNRFDSKNIINKFTQKNQ